MPALQIIGTLADNRDNLVRENFSRVVIFRFFTKSQEWFHNRRSPSSGANETFNQRQDDANFGPIAISITSG